MRNFINLLVCGLVLTIFTNCNLRNNKSAQVEHAQIKAVVESKNQYKEDFYKFIERFHSDTVFRISRSAERLVKNYNFWKEFFPDTGIEEADLLWGKLRETVHFLDTASRAYCSDRFEKTIDIKNDSIAWVTMKMDARDFCSDSYIICRYKLNDGLWVIYDFEGDVANSCFD